MRLGELCFPRDAVEEFANWSGDRNPLHLDAEYASKSQFGRTIVHGVLVSLRAIELWLFQAGTSTPHGLSEISATFMKPVFSGELLVVHSENQKGGRVRLSVEADGTVLVRIGIREQAARNPVEDWDAPFDRSLFPVSPLPFDGATIATRRGDMKLQADVSLMQRQLPRLVDLLGSRAVAGLSLLSTIVGMECPGERSLLTEYRARLRSRSDGAHDSIHYRVTYADLSKNFVTLDVDGPDCNASVTAFVRPDSVKQPSVQELRDLVDPQEFTSETAVVVGGSRGLGEVSAKLLALGGARVLLTYRNRAEDAERVADEIREAGFQCATLKWDAQERAALLAVDGYECPTMLLYFASPHIFRRRTKPYSPVLFAEYTAVYVDALAKLVEQFGAPNNRMAILFPSTSMLDGDPNLALEYAMAKAAGETYCTGMAAENSQLVFELPRLPRVLTDQTNTVVQASSAQAPAVLLPVLRRMRQQRMFDEPSS